LGGARLDVGPPVCIRVFPQPVKAVPFPVKTCCIESFPVREAGPFNRAGPSSSQS
jgi:hypothetical protein